MTASGPPPRNPFLLPGSGATPLAPLCPWKVPAHRDHYVPIGDSAVQHAKFTKWLASKVEGGLVLVAGGSGTGKTAVLNACVRLLVEEPVRPGATVHVVDLSSALRSVSMTVSQRRTAVCWEILDVVRREKLVADDVLASLEAIVAKPDHFHVALSSALTGPALVLAVLLPPVEDLVAEAVGYAESAHPWIFFFTESAYLAGEQLNTVDRLGASTVVLETRELGPGDLRTFVSSRLDHPVEPGAFPKINDSTVTRLSTTFKTIGQAQGRLYRIYENRLRKADRYGNEDWVTFDDVMSDDGAQLIEPLPPPVEAPAHVRWLTDVPTKEDLFRREALATVLSQRLRETRDTEPDTSLLMHVDGAWGSGKSTLLELLAAKLTTDGFTVVRFDAWQQSRLSVPWWSLLTGLRLAVLKQRTWTRPWLHVCEALARARHSGAPFAVALVVLSLLSAGAWFGVSRLLGTGVAAPDAVKVIGAAVPAVVLLWSAARLTSRVLMWRSAGGARLFEQSDSNPAARIVGHFAWLLRRSRKPVVFFVDDLDRCPGEYVVDLLDSVQTLVRDYPGRAERKPKAASFVVAADGAWLRSAYAAAHPTADSSAGSIGYRFADKLFQFTIPMPGLSTTDREVFLRHLLAIDAAEPRTEEIAEASSRVRAAAGHERGILQVIDSISDAGVRDVVARVAAVEISKAPARADAEHALAKFASLLSGNPREIKLFLNTYGMLRAIRTLEGNTVETDVLALWSIVRVRWPAIADHLQSVPESVRALKDPRWFAADFPEDLRTAIHDEQLRTVVLHPVGGPLTPIAIRRCCGSL
ncbi:KAP family P-loop NTPase fold protein [Umezawaea tangerina]|uniref:KAP-like P-loop domain-containing protein n=1 Tax=Umezawaea tangerina TaxID=84725 RepID=A0A2T0SWR6_9PSEU|nr:P-loop NTPase fold protein [Umezawaea tangerina]PRY37830.1 KAP-like P-loop domain-containing protein [Umezawaea tangerina]